MNKKIFWEVIEKNKDNPLNFQYEINDLSLEDMFGFFIILENKEKGFINISKFTNSLKEENIYKAYWLDDIIFRGECFYNAFLEKDKDKIKKILKENPSWKDQVMTIYEIERIYGLKIAKKNSNEYNKLKNTNDQQLIHEYFDKFWNMVRNCDIKKHYFENDIKQIIIDTLKNSFKDTRYSLIYGKKDNFKSPLHISIYEKDNAKEILHFKID
jgi:hypothetical protein